MDSIGEQLAAARKAKGLSQKDLAEQMYVTRTTVSHWEHGRHKPDVETMRRLGELLSFDLVKQEGAASWVPDKSNHGRKWLTMAAVVITVVICMMLGPWNHGRMDAAWFEKTELPRTGHAYLKLQPQVNRDADGWWVVLQVEETSGINIALTELQAWVFEDETRHYSWNTEQLDKMLENRALTGYQNRAFSFELSGNPGTKVGILLKGVDEAGATLSFRTLTELKE